MIISHVKCTQRRQNNNGIISNQLCNPMPMSSGMTRIVRDEPLSVASGRESVNLLDICGDLA